MIRKLASGEYRLYAPKKVKTGKRCNHKFGTFKTRAAAEQQQCKSFNRFPKTMNNAG